MSSQINTSWLMVQIFINQGTITGMSVSMLEADFQCKHKIKNNNVFAEWGLSLFCLSATNFTVSSSLMAPPSHVWQGWLLLLGLCPNDSKSSFTASLEWAPLLGRPLSWSGNYPLFLTTGIGIALSSTRLKLLSLLRFLKDPSSSNVLSALLLSH